MNRQFCTFHVGDLFLGIEVNNVQEVLRGCEITPVPAAPPEIRGLINLRGQIVPAIDLRSRFGIDEGADGPFTVLVLATGTEPLSFVVDRAGDVVDVDEENFEQPPDTLTGEPRRLIQGAHKLEDSLLLVLDLEHAVTIDIDGSGEKEQ
ncbi:MAG: chemotaxis protein CheW [Acidobacteriota bacterium]|jgi:purine-binding chemotaxis protein CheW